MAKPVYILAVAKIAPRVIFYMAASMAGVKCILFADFHYKETNVANLNVNSCCLGRFNQCTQPALPLRYKQRSTPHIVRSQE